LGTLKERFELASESIGLGVWDWNVESGDLYWDDQMYRLYDFDPNQVGSSYDIWKSRVHPDDIGHAEYLLKELVAGREEYRTEFRVVHENGHMVWITAAAVVEKNGAGNVIRVVGINWDSSQRKLSELNYLNSQRRLRAIINAAEDFSIITTDVDGTIELFSRGSELMLGYDAAEIENKQNPAIFHDLDEVVERGKELSQKEGEDISGFDVFVHKAKKGLNDVNQWTYKHKSGRQIQVELTISAVKDVDNNITGFLGVAQDITENLKAQSDLKSAIKQSEEQKLLAEQAHKQFQGLFHHAPEALILVNTQGCIVQANIRAHDLFAYDDRELLGQQLDILVPSHVRNQHQTWVDGYTEEPKARIMAPNLEFQGQRKNGNLVALNINLSPILIEGIQHTIATVRDVTLQQKTQKLLAEAAEKAEATSRAKSEFVASMSHEIRTPMNAVLASSQLLNNTDLDENQSRYLNMIQSSGQALLGILNDILDFSKIEAGKFELQDNEFDFNKLCEALTSIMSPNATQKNIELVIGLDTKLPHLVQGDGPRLQQVLINLLGNAIKFTETGEVFLNITQLERKDDKVSLRFEIQDTGIGITSEDLRLLFNAFSQVDGSNTRQYGGTGLGLSISQRLVKLMGGEIKVESKINEGSKFYFDLELPIKSEKSREYQRLETLHFIVVDDNQHSKNYIVRYIEAWGYRCESFQSLEAIELKDTKACCLLLDWSLPSDVMSYVRSLGSDLQKRVFIMQFESERSDVSELDRARIAGTISKPVLSSTLYDSLMTVLAAEVKEDSDTSRKVENPLENHCILLVEDNALNQVVANEILSDLGAKVEIASNGLEAVNLLKESANHFDMVLMDVQMPVMDGYTATHAIREELQLDLPILAMTAGVMEREKQSCLDAGMNDFIAKPINIEIMLQTILKNIP
jgi:two-component system sensor histidine kinase/response regulator